MITCVKALEFYQGLDVGIRFPVRVLHYAGIETCQSCQGGDGHSYEYPTVDLPSNGARDAYGFNALNPLANYGLDVMSLALHWHIGDGGYPYEIIWRVTLRQAWPDRAEEVPMFMHGYTNNQQPIFRDPNFTIEKRNR